MIQLIRLAPIREPFTDYETSVELSYMGILDSNIARNKVDSVIEYNTGNCPVISRSESGQFLQDNRI
jgi:hypothetical protein